MSSKKIYVENVLKIVDIDCRQLSPELVSFLSIEIQPTYRDTQLNEHIYDIGSLLDNGEIEECSDELKEEFERVNKILTKKGAGYLRIILN